MRRSPGGFDKAGAGVSRPCLCVQHPLLESNLEEFLPMLSPHLATQISAQAQRELGSEQARVPNLTSTGHALDRCRHLSFPLGGLRSLARVARLPGDTPGEALPPPGALRALAIVHGFVLVSVY